MANKQKRLTIEEKVNIITKLDMGARAVDLAEQYGLNKSSISRIRQKKETIISTKRKLDEIPTEFASKKKNTKLNFTQVDSALYHWFVQMRALAKPISGPLLQEKALLLNALIGGPETSKASNSWLDRWKKRYKIRQLSIQGEKLSANEEGSANFTQAFKGFITEHNYGRNQIYNADETGLMWKQLPRKTLVTQSERSASGQKAAKDRVTLMVCANADGTHKIPMLILGKAKKPRCFNNAHQVPIAYKGSKTAWMTRVLFKEWYVEIFLPELIKQHGSNARCLLLLDNAPSHPPAEELNALSDVCHVMYLPPNVTALIQPMDQGVIEKTKKLYRRFLLEHILLIDSADNLTKFLKKWNMLNVCNGLAVAWTGVTATNIKNSFKNLLGDSEIPQYEEVLDTLRFREWVNQIPGFDGITQEEISTWLQDEDDSGWQIMDDEQLLALANGILHELNEHVEGEEDEDDDDTEQELEEEIPLTEALEGVEKFQKWYQTRWESSPNEIFALEKHAAFLRQLILEEQKRL